MAATETRGRDARDEAGRDEEMAAKDGCHGDTDARAKAGAAMDGCHEGRY